MSFDVVSSLSVHFLSHTIDPCGLLKTIYDLLRPGGFLFLSEKDIRFVMHTNAPLPLEYPNC